VQFSFLATIPYGCSPVKPVVHPGGCEGGWGARTQIEDPSTKECDEATSSLKADGRYKY